MFKVVSVSDEYNTILLSLLYATITIIRISYLYSLTVHPNFYPKDDDSSDTHAGTDMAAQESSKEEECQAICQLRGVGPGSPLSLQLKAIDEEYHHLLEAKQGGKADHVQGLFLWKSKQATQVGLIY